MRARSTCPAVRSPRETASVPDQVDFQGDLGAGRDGVDHFEVLLGEQLVSLLCGDDQVRQMALGSCVWTASGSKKAASSSPVAKRDTAWW